MPSACSGSTPSRWRSLLLRWLKFNFVGALGILVQLAALALLVSGLGMGYLWGTALAVEVAVLHNFVWHERFTWRDRTRSRAGALGRLLRFNLTTGLISIGGNLVLMRLLVGALGVRYLPANMIAIAALSFANFAASHWFVFAERGRR
ncbi:MAG: GtrA family protein [Bryobacteraceae bacterium]